MGRYRSRSNSPTASSTVRTNAHLVKLLCIGFVAILILVEIQRQALRHVMSIGTFSIPHDAESVQQQQQVVTTAESFATSTIGSSSISGSTSSTSSGFSACLSLQTEQDARYLTEWIAYHWYVMPLRNLIVWNDPMAVNPTLLKTLLKPWSQSTTTKLDITVWDHPSQIYPTGYSNHRRQHTTTNSNQHQQKQHTYNDATGHYHNHHDRIRARNVRQDVFFGMCLRTLKRQGHSWTLLSHVDEYALINPRLRNTSDPLYQTWQTTTMLQSTSSSSSATDNTTNINTTMDMVLPPQQHESGSVLVWLQRMSPYASNTPNNHDTTTNQPPNIVLSQPCIPLTSKQFGTLQQQHDTTKDQETDLKLSLMWNSNTNSPAYTNTTATATTTATAMTLSPPPTTNDFLTLKWHYWGHPEHDSQPPKVRFHLLDLTRIPPSLLHWKVDAHWPIPHDDLCPLGGANGASANSANAMHERNNMFVSHHYSGIMEQIAFGEHQQQQHQDTTTTTATLLHLEEETRIHTDTIHNTYWEGHVITQWLQGFITSVGDDYQAKQLLEYVGHGP